MLEEMVASKNTSVDLVVKGTSFLGWSSYGQIMVGNNAFEFYNDRNVADYIQIPWEEVDYVCASVYFKGKWIPRYVIATLHNGTYTFASKEPLKVLKAIKKYVPADHIVKSLTFFQVVKRGLKRKEKDPAKSAN